MSTSRKVFYLFATLAIIFFTPYVALYLKCGGIPEGFFDFPATEARDKPQIDMTAIVIISVLFVTYILLLLFPRLFGFKKPNNVNVESKKKTHLPVWFWVGLVLWSTILVLFIGKFPEPKWVMNWALVPLWWGFILMLDGIVYSRNDGKSLVKDAPGELIAMGVLSISGWLIFEYFNFFIELNWYYEAARLMPHDEFLLYAIIGSSAFIPMAFEWYLLLCTFPSLVGRYKQGRKVQYSSRTKVILMVIAFALFFGMTFYPEVLFYAVWLGPIAIIVVVLSILDIRTPFTPIKEKGDWTSLIFFSFVWVLQGLCVECWNFLSYEHPISPTFNPGYWDYCIPYVNIGFVFNMPLLGYLGYVPFGIYCCIWVIAMAFLMNIQFPVSLGQHIDKE